MGSRSGRKLTNAERKENRRKRLKLKKKHKKPRPANQFVPSQYLEVHSAVKQYISCYVNSFHSQKSYSTLVPGAGMRSLLVREPVKGQKIILDVKCLKYENDWCSLDVAFHETATTIAWHGGGSTNRWSMCFSDPNFFPKLRVFLDKVVAQYWGCGSFSGDIAKAGGVLDFCVPDISRFLDASNIELAKIERSEGPLDLAPSYELRRNGRSMGSLTACDGFIRFGSVREPMAWIAKGYTHAFASRVAEEVRKHDTSCSRD